jgi:Spy/CpxP family protein refolding chaperone
MKNNLNYILTIVLLALPILAGVAQNRQQGPQRQQAFNKEQLHHASIPDLTDDQRAKMKEYRLDMQKKMLPLMNQMGENKARMRTLSTAESVDMKAIYKLIDGKAGIMAKMMKIRAENRQNVRKMLTEEQRIVFDSKSRSFTPDQRHQGMARREVKYEKRRSFNNK